jgi:hypothetical protein
MEHIRETLVEMLSDEKFVGRLADMIVARLQSHEGESQGSTSVEDSLQQMYDEMVSFAKEHMEDVPLPPSPENMATLGERISYSIDLLRDILTVTADYHHTRGKISSLVGFMLSVANNTAFTSIRSQASVIRHKWEQEDATPTGSMDTQAEQKAEEYAEKKQSSKTIDLSARLKQKQKEKAARLGLVDD